MKNLNKNKVKISLEYVKKSSNIKTYLICSSAFKIENSYNPSNVYTDGLYNILKSIDKLFKNNVVYRLYYDESIENDNNWIYILNEMKKRKYCELVKYECPLFKNGIYHHGLFGTFIRYMPLFQKKDWDVYTNIDIDNKLPYLTIVQFKNDNSKFAFKTQPCYYLNPHVKIDNLKPQMSIIGSLVMSKIVFNKKILFNFLNNIYYKKKEYLIFLKNIKDLPKNHYKKKKYNSDYIVPYGLDEFFLNNNLLKYLIDNNITYSYIIINDNYYIGLWTIFDNNNSLKNLSPDVEKFYLNFTKKVLGEKYDLNKTLSENYIYIINIILYVKDNDSIKYIEISQKELIKVFKNGEYKKYNIPEEIYNCINLKRPIPKSKMILSSNVLNTVNNIQIKKGGSNQNKKKSAIDLICWYVKNCETRTKWDDKWLQYLPDNNLNWYVNIDLKPLFPKNKYLDFKSPLEKLYKYYNVNYFKLLLDTLKKTTFEKIDDVIYIDNDDYELNQILYYYLYNFQNIFILNLWPINKNIFNSKDNFIKIINLLKQNGKIHFIKKMKISQREALPLFFQLYSNNDIINNLKNIINKVTKCGWSNKENLNKKEDVMIIFYEPFDNNLLSGPDSRIKNDIRLLLTKIDNKNVKNKAVNIKSYLHVNDTFIQSIEIASIYLNKKNFEFFNIINFNRFMNMINFRGKVMFLMFKKWLYYNFQTIDTFRSLIFSSYILFLVGLRTPTDLDVFIYHNPIKAKTKNFNELVKIGADRGGYFGFLDLTCKGFGEWQSTDSYKNKWFTEEWPNLFNAKDYEEMLFDPRYHINFLGLKIGCFEADLVRREKRARAASYSNLIAIKYYNIKDIKIPKIPEEYFVSHTKQYYKTPAEKILLFKKIKSILQYNYKINLSFEEIAKYLGEDYDKLKLKGNK